MGIGCVAHLHVLPAAKAFQFRRGVTGILRAHPFDDKTVLDDLIDILFLVIQILLNLVGLLDEAGMLVEVHPGQIIVYLLSECSLLVRAFDHPAGIGCHILEEIVLA